MKAGKLNRGLLVLVAVLLMLPALLGQLPVGSGVPAGTPATTQPKADPIAAAHAPPGARITDEGWFAPKTFGADHTARPGKPSNVFVIPMREEITAKTFESLKRKALQARARGVDVLVIDMDTWGGQAIAALDIARFIKVDLKSIHTVCFTNTRSVSAGAIIGLACDELIVAPNATLGDAAPILREGKLEGVEREKIETVLRSEVASSAERNGYSSALARSMISIKLEVLLVRNKLTHELRFVLADEFRGQLANPDSGWEQLRVVVPDTQLLTMHSKEAADYGFAAATVPAEGPPYSALMKEMGASNSPTVLADSWLEGLIAFLTNPWITGLLLFFSILFAYIEFNTPGFGVPGTLAVVCFAILLGSRFMSGEALWWEIAMFVLGLALLLIEIFVLPGFGVCGILGIILMLVGLVMIVINNAPGEAPWSPSLDWSTFTYTVLAMAGGLVGAIFAGLAIGRYLPKLPVASRLVLAETKVAPAPSQTAGVTIGQTGVARTICRPIGKAIFGEQLRDVMCEGGMIEPGTPVRVIRLTDNTVVVEKA